MELYLHSPSGSAWYAQCPVNASGEHVNVNVNVNIEFI